MFGNNMLVNGKIHTLTTNEDGVTFTIFPYTAAVACNIINSSDIDIEFRRNGEGETISIAAGNSYFIIGITNLDQIGIRAASEVTIKAESFIINSKIN